VEWAGEKDTLTMDLTSEKRLLEVNSRLADLIRQMDTQYQSMHTGDYLTVQQGLRSYSQQQAIYAQGRTTPGSIVTNAPPGHSWHEFGLAVDVCPESLLSVSGWGASDPKWTEIAVIGRGLGLYAGADFSHPDRPHFQLTGSLPVSPDDATRNTYANGGLFAVWQAAGLPFAPVDVDGEISV
jgi:hypothetical protein